MPHQNKVNLPRLLGLFFWLAVAVAATSESHAADPSPESLQKWLTTQNWVRDTKGPIIELGPLGDFDDTHLLTPLVALEKNRFRMWYTGSRGEVSQRQFQVGLATSKDGRNFSKHGKNPIYSFGDGKRSILTPTLLRDPQGTVLREQGKLRMWFSAADLAGDRVHTLHDATSEDGFQWTSPSKSQLRDIYSPTIIKENGVYRMWFIDVSGPTWVVRHATSNEGSKWNVSPETCLQVDQPWESKNLFYPTVVKCDGVYLMWYGSYWSKHSQKTALGLAVSLDGIHWTKNPSNPVFRPDPSRPWESHYTTSQSVMRLDDGSWRMWYTSRKKPPHVNKYFAIGTARWAGPDFEEDARKQSRPMPNPAVDREAFVNWQKATRAKLGAMLGLPKHRVPLKPEQRGQIERDGLVIEKWIFSSESGSRVPALLYRKKQQKGPMPAVVLTYGHGGSKSQPAYQYIAQLYAKMGIAVLAIDPAGEEERHIRGGLGTRAHDPFDVHHQAWSSGRPILGKLVWDAMRGVDFLLEREDIDPSRIGVAGNSLGGALAGWMAVLDPRLCCAVVSGWAFDDVMMDFGKYCTRVPNQHMRQICDWPEYLSLAAPHCSILVANGDADIIIDQKNDGSAWKGTRKNTKSANRTFAALGKPKGVTTWFQPGGGHRPYPANKASLEWLVEQLQPAGWSSQKVEDLESINFGEWTKTHGFKLDSLYNTQLHLLGASVVEMEIRPFKKQELACLLEKEHGSPEYTLKGWLDRLRPKETNRVNRAREAEE